VFEFHAHLFAILPKLIPLAISPVWCENLLLLSHARWREASIKMRPTVKDSSIGDSRGPWLLYLFPLWNSVSISRISYSDSDASIERSHCQSWASLLAIGKRTWAHESRGQSVGYMQRKKANRANGKREWTIAFESWEELPARSPERLWKTRVYRSQGRSLRWKDLPTRALRIQGLSKVEDRKVEEMHLEISLPWMTGEKQKNLRQHYAGPPLSSLWTRGASGSRALSSQDEVSPLDGGSIYWTELQRRWHRLLRLRPLTFPWPCSAADRWPIGGIWRPGPSWVNQPTSLVYFMRVTLHPTLLLHWWAQIVLLRSLSLVDRGNRAPIMNCSFCSYISSDQAGTWPPHLETWSRGLGHWMNPSCSFPPPKLLSSLYP
jgi:hypothetical protein